LAVALSIGLAVIYIGSFVERATARSKRERSRPEADENLPSGT
jgi:hypothetical protein